jgi:hypothetical protein
MVSLLSNASNRRAPERLAPGRRGQAAGSRRPPPPWILIPRRGQPLAGDRPDLEPATAREPRATASV